MEKPASVFIMDVTQSQSFPYPDELTRYLGRTVGWINEVGAFIPRRLTAKHRFGDEVILVAEGYDMAYVLAFYIKLTWAYSGHMPYFGLSFGDMVSDFPVNNDVDTWNSPIVKRARNALDALKAHKPSSRPWLLFGVDGGVDPEIELLNELAVIQDRFFKLQSSADRIVSCLYTVQGLQEKVAATLNKNKSTVSRQVRKSNVDLLLTVKSRMSHILNMAEATLSGATGPARDRTLLDEIVISMFSENVSALLNNLRTGDEPRSPHGD